MTRAAGLDTFERAYAEDPDPWRTLSDRDEAWKRRAILHALGPGRWGRVLELGAGVGANSVPLAERSLRLDATDGAERSVARLAAALEGRPNARALRLRLPARFPRPTYDAVVVAELLYYLPPAAMTRLARTTRRALRPGGRLVLAHHHVDFHDFAQTSAGLHGCFVAQVGGLVARGARTRTSRWCVEAFVRGGAAST